MVSTAITPPQLRANVLHNGDRLSREDFHRLYRQLPENIEAELIGGVVFMSAAMRRKHGTNHLPLGTVFFAYESSTPGTESSDNTTMVSAPSPQNTKCHVRTNLNLRNLKVHSLLLSYEVLKEPKQSYVFIARFTG